MLTLPCRALATYLTWAGGRVGHAHLAAIGPAYALPMPSKPHPFFWISMAALLLAGVSAATASGCPPDIALKSMAVYRCEVGFVIFAAGYTVSLLLWLSYCGQVLRIDFPGGGKIDPTSAGRLPTPWEGFPEAPPERDQTHLATRARQ